MFWSCEERYAIFSGQWMFGQNAEAVYSRCSATDALSDYFEFAIWHQTSALDIPNSLAILFVIVDYICSITEIGVVRNAMFLLI